MRKRVGAIGEKVRLLLLRNGTVALSDIISLARRMKRDVLSAVPGLVDVARFIEFRFFVSQTDEPVAVKKIVASFVCLRERHFQR